LLCAHALLLPSPASTSTSRLAYSLYQLAFT
jgi:hypothetical protein